MKLKLTEEQATILYRLLNEQSSLSYLAEMDADLKSREMYDLWDQLDEEMINRGLPCVGYGETEERTL
jgi:hypothetical protein